MEMPVVSHCFGAFPPRYGCTLIAIAGLAIGGFGIAGIVLFGILENFIQSRFNSNQPLNATMKKMVLCIIGGTSLFLLTGNLMLFFGSTLGKRGLVGGAKVTFLMMCLVLLGAMIYLPISCYFLDNYCHIKHIPTLGTVAVYLLGGVFVWFWLYFMVVAYNLQQEL